MYKWGSKSELAVIAPEDSKQNWTWLPFLPPPTEPETAIKLCIKHTVYMMFRTESNLIWANKLTAQDYALVC